MIVICLVLLIVFLVAFSLAQIHPLQTYLVAARSLPAGTILTNDDLQSRDLDPGAFLHQRCWPRTAALSWGKKW